MSGRRLLLAFLLLALPVTVWTDTEPAPPWLAQLRPESWANSPKTLERAFENAISIPAGGRIAGWRCAR